MLRLLLMADNETATSLIGNGMLALLRYDPPAQAFFRRALSDREVNGFEVRSLHSLPLRCRHA